MRPFSAEEDSCINAWIRKFEDTAKLASWNLKKIVSAKMLLKSVAKQFVESKRGIVSRNSLKNCSIKHFFAKVN